MKPVLRWKRYAVIHTRADNSPFTDRIGTYPTRWLANWAAAHRIQRALNTDYTTPTYVVRELSPRTQPTYWPALQANQAHRWYPIPSAHVTAGSEIVHTSLGFTRWHALGRAGRWAKPRSQQQVQIARWSDEPTFAPDTD